MDNPAAANALGTIGAVCWSVQLIPQIIINYRRHNATGLQPTMMMFWAWAGVPLGVYNIVSDFNKALWVQPQILTVLSLITWSQCRYYQDRWTISKCIAITLPIACIMGGIQAALILALDIGKQRGIQWPLTLMAVLAALFLALGVLRHYYDIYRHKTVRGISFIFVGLDAMGDLTSLLSILFEPSLDVLGLVVYGVELALWLGIFACGGYLNLIPWLRKTWSSRQASVLQAVDHAIAMHDLPSSTSVFRTPSAEQHALRTRHVAVDRAEQSWKTVKGIDGIHYVHLSHVYLAGFTLATLVRTLFSQRGRLFTIRILLAFTMSYKHNPPTPHNPFAKPSAPATSSTRLPHRTMATNKAIEKIEEAESSAMNSGQTSPSYNPTIFSGHKRSNSAETVDSEVTEIGSPSVSVNNMPGPPVNTPATTSIAGETPISSPCDAGSIAAILHGMPSKLISPPASVTTEHKGMTKPKGAAGNMRKSVLKKRLTSKSAGEPGDTTTFENSVWEDFAEEDAKNALKRLAMLAKDEHKRSHEAQPLSNYYSARLAKIVQEAEIEFDPVFLQKFARAAEVAKQSELVDKDVIME